MFPVDISLKNLSNCIVNKGYTFTDQVIVWGHRVINLICTGRWLDHAGILSAVKAHFEENKGYLERSLENWIGFEEHVVKLFDKANLAPDFERAIDAIRTQWDKAKQAFDGLYRSYNSPDLTRIDRPLNTLRVQQTTLCTYVNRTFTPIVKECSDLAKVWNITAVPGLTEAEQRVFAFTQDQANPLPENLVKGLGTPEHPLTPERFKNICQGLKEKLEKEYGKTPDGKKRLEIVKFLETKPFENFHSEGLEWTTNEKEGWDFYINELCLKSSIELRKQVIFTHTSRPTILEELISIQQKIQVRNQAAEALNKMVTPLIAKYSQNSPYAQYGSEAQKLIDMHFSFDEKMVYNYLMGGRDWKKKLVECAKDSNQSVEEYAHGLMKRVNDKIESLSKEKAIAKESQVTAFVNEHAGINFQLSIIRAWGLSVKLEPEQQKLYHEWDPVVGNLKMLYRAWKLYDTFGEMMTAVVALREALEKPVAAFKEKERKSVKE